MTNAHSYKPLAFANEFISLSSAGVEHMKLQKLCYLSYGWWLAYRPNPIMNEPPQVWKHGPVFYSLYNVLKGNGGKPILLPQKDIFFEEPPRLSGENDRDANQLANWIWQQYGQYSSFELSDLSHQEGSPWQIVAKANDYRVPRNYAIPEETMRTYFKALAKEISPKA